jgi:hypothetical protein
MLLETLEKNPEELFAFAGEDQIRLLALQLGVRDPFDQRTIIFREHPSHFILVSSLQIQCFPKSQFLSTNSCTRSAVWLKPPFRSSGRVAKAR